MDAKNPELGYFAVSKLEVHKGAFKKPTLREIASTAPPICMTDLKRLWEEVVGF